MEKIISLFQRNYETDRLVRDEVVPGAEWVLAGEGVATEKIDGTCMMIRAGKLYKRYDAKKGKKPPPGFEPAQEPDPITGHWPGWLAVNETDPADKWARMAFEANQNKSDGTYELIGPHVSHTKVNPYPHLQADVLVRHGNHVLHGVPRDFAGLKAYFEAHPDYEGIVWHHANGRMVKIKRRDFGLPWPALKE